MHTRAIQAPRLATASKRYLCSLSSLNTANQQPFPSMIFPIYTLKSNEIQNQKKGWIPAPKPTKEKKPTPHISLSPIRPAATGNNRILISYPMIPTPHIPLPDPINLLDCFAHPSTKYPFVSRGSITPLSSHGRICEKSCDGGGGIKFSEALVDFFLYEYLYNTGRWCLSRALKLCISGVALEAGAGETREEGLSWGLCTK